MKGMNEKIEQLPQEYLTVYNAIANSDEKYVTKKSILAKIQKPVSYDRKLRAIIKDLAERYKMPVGASSAPETKGYFIIETKHDLYIAQRDIKSRAFNLNERAKALGELDIS